MHVTQFFILMGSLPAEQAVEQAYFGDGRKQNNHATIVNESDRGLGCVKKNIVCTKTF